MKKIKVFSLVIAFLLSANLSLAADGGDKPMNYLAVKAGIYSPSNDFDVQEIGGDELDSRTGFAGEVAFGRYINRVLAMELGAGYFESKGTRELAEDARLKVVPVVITAKVMLPIGPVDPYAEFGVGGYFNKVRNFQFDETSGTKAMFGLHAGIGIDFNITDAFLLGLEGRYLWTDNSWGSSYAKLDGFITTANLGFRY